MQAGGALTATALLQVNSLQEMDAKIDSMARSGALDPALLLTLAKAHTSVKDTDYTREEVKDVMAHLYFKVSPACINYQYYLPVSGDVVKHLTYIPHLPVISITVI